MMLYPIFWGIIFVVLTPDSQFSLGSRFWQFPLSYIPSTTFTTPRVTFEPQPKAENHMEAFLSI